MRKVIKGQEAVCPDGLGRVAEIGDIFCGHPKFIRVDTYIDNRSCKWAAHNVKLVEINLAEVPKVSIAQEIIEDDANIGNIGETAIEAAIQAIYKGEDTVTYWFTDNSSIICHRGVCTVTS